MVLTHPNADHLNGLRYIARHFHVKNLWTNGESEDMAAYFELMDIAKQKEIHAVPYAEFSKKQGIHQAAVEILYPPDDFLEKSKTESWRNANNNSLVMRISFGKHSFLFTGDIMKEAEAEISAMCGNRLQSTVMTAPHHGSRSSATKRFLENVSPEIITISCGFHNRFKFPHSSVVKRFAKAGCRVLRTDVNGAISFKTDGEILTIRSYQ